MSIVLHKQLMVAEAIEKSPFVPYIVKTIPQLERVPNQTNSAYAITISLLMIPVNIIPKKKNCGI
jgi:hypothetical protein